MRSTSKPAAIAFGVAAVLAITGCGGGGGGPKHSADADGLEEATRNFTEGFIDEDARGVYEFATDDCKEEVPEDEFEEQFEGAIALVKSFSDKDFDEAEVDDIETRDVSETEGESRAVVVDSDGDSFFEEGEEGDFDQWVYEDGGWRFEACDQFDLEAQFDSGFGELETDLDTGFATDFDTTELTDDTGASS